MSHETILVVDDNLQMAEFLAGELLPALGYDEILVVHDGKSAMEVIRTYQPDLILLDFQLSDTTGLEVLRRLASEGHNVPTILITAEGSEQIAVDAFRLGVQDYLIKPMTADSLSSAIARALAEAQGRLAYLIEEYQAEITLPDTWPLALGHGLWVEEVWVNYPSNGIKYGGQPPRLELGATV